MSPSERTRREFLATASAVGAAGAIGASSHGAVRLKPSEGAAIASADAAPHGIKVPAWYYQHFDADYALDVPEEGFGGWKQEPLVISAAHTGVVLMHAWDAGTREQFPGWHRVVPYIPRANAICRDVLPKLIEAVRASEVPLFHVVGGGSYGRDLPGCKRAVELAGPEPAPLPQVDTDPIRDKLAAFKNACGFPGTHNKEDIDRGFARLDFAPGTRPLDCEGVAENGPQLFALCKEKGVNHLIYAGFAINWCLLLSPGGMAEMQRYGLMCSALRQATTAVENKESARREWCKELALWRVALAFGFVFDVDDFVEALKSGPRVPVA